MIIAVDFDGTIVEHEYPRIGKPIPFAIEVLKKLQEEEGHTLILWTMREGKLLQDAINFCESRGLKFYAHNKNYPDEIIEEGTIRKISADIYIDDRNIGGLFDWGIIYRIIKSGANRIENLDMLENRMQKENKNWFIRMGEALEKAKRGY
ncbi:MAG: hypothetical protein LBP83_01225 [Dysgonamonadaceae bacterium]|jgi:hydroxymethylpyrimidine pyrophosphatase-like HAD family hydrolase|nr:hypothetical protein [Dysgonamonadaceae bacterium]